MTRIRSTVLALALLTTLVAPRALAQEDGQGGDPHAGSPHGGSPHGGSPHGAGGRSPFDAPPVATAEPSRVLSPGTVRVTVLDVEGRPVEGATVVLGTMAQGGDRNRVSGLTDAEGRFTWSDLPTGTAQAYRVTVPHEDATYGATPFQLPPDHGYDVRVVRLPTTHDDRTVLQLVGQTSVEVRDERLHVIQQVQLANMAQTPQTYVFPEGGLRIPLPEGFLVFQTQPVMTDQRVEEVAGYGLRIRGSLPPGRVNLVWAYDLPITGRNMDIRFAVPFRTYIYRVITDAPPGMELVIDGLPEPDSLENQGRPLFLSEVQRRPGDEPFESFTLRFRNIPGPGPLRWIAVAIAVAMIAVGAGFAARRGGGPDQDSAAKERERRKKELLDEAAQLETELAAGEIGPQYRQSRHDAIVRELAVLLHQQRSSASQDATSAARRGPRSPSPRA